MFTPQRLDLSKTQTWSASTRHNLVRIDNLLNPGDPVGAFTSPAFETLAGKMREARDGGHIVSMFYGAHVIKCGLSRYLIRMLEEGMVTRLASNGAGSIHDFELAMLGGTSEHVPTAIEDGSFGMWEETGWHMNEAIRQGAAKGIGYGQSLAEYVDAHPALFPYRADCVFYQAYLHNVPMTYHVTIGTDIIDQHPHADFAAKGLTSGIDFSIFCKGISELDMGCHLNVGSSVTGPEVFLKALSIARNQGYPTFHITTANFDIIPLGDYKSDVSKEHFHYYYRPRKNVINRPASCGGTGVYIEGNHLQTIPNLYERLKQR